MEKWRNQTMNERLVNETLSELSELLKKSIFIEYDGNWWDLYADMNGERTHIASGFNQDLVFDLEQFIVIAKLARGSMYES